MRVSIKALQYFLLAAERGSIAKAAKELSVVPSAVSSAIECSYGKGARTGGRRSGLCNPEYASINGSHLCWRRGFGCSDPLGSKTVKIGDWAPWRQTTQPKPSLHGYLPQLFHSTGSKGSDRTLKPNFMTSTRSKSIVMNTVRQRCTIQEPRDLAQESSETCAYVDS